MAIFKEITITENDYENDYVNVKKRCIKGDSSTNTAQ